MQYAAFIMTFKRAEVLSQTIDKLRAQSVPPALILIVDNDVERSAEQVAKNMACEYFAVGYNSGPAGAAYFGLKILFEKDWKWVLWVDDDDPPVLVNQIELQLSIAAALPSENNVGIIGAVGSRFDRSRAILKRIPNEELIGNVHVDTVSGGQFPLVSKKLYHAGILPNPTLFFGFEELEFCCRVSAGGFQMLVPGELMLELRSYFSHIEKRKVLYQKRAVSALWREYYSTRGMVAILMHQKGLKTLTLYSFRVLAKSIYTFRYGVKYGFGNLKYVTTGLFDGLRKRMGIRFLPIPKAS